MRRLDRSFKDDGASFELRENLAIEKWPIGVAANKVENRDRENVVGW